MGRIAAGGLLALGIEGLLAAGGARRPVVRVWPRSLLQAAPSLPASEVPGALTAVHAAAAGAALLSGGPLGVAAGVANGLAVAALADLRADADRSARVFDAALAGLPRPAELPGRLTGGAGRARHLRAEDVAYGDAPEQRLDVWGPPGARDAPVLVQVHGGGWTSGSRRVSAAPLLGHLVERGWVCVTVDYRLAPGHRLADQVADVKGALAWVRRGIAAHGGDPGFVAISGGSAGGHLASLAALTAGDPALRPSDIGADADAPLAAAVPVYGVHDLSRDEHGLHRLLRDTVIGAPYDPAVWLPLSPLHRVADAVAAGAAPPFLVVHGTADTIVSVGQSRRFVRRMREAGADVRHAELPRAQHGFDSFPTSRTGHHVRAVHRFLTAVHDRYRSRGAL